MAVFNFEIKRQSYEIAVKQTREALCAEDTESGKYYLGRALELCAQLEANSAVPQLKERYATERRKLLKLQTSLGRGVNPFLQKRDTDAPRGAASDGGAKAGSGGNAVSPSGKNNGGDGADGAKQKPQFFGDRIPSTTLNDVAGLTDVKKQIRLRVIAPMKDRDLYDSYMDEAGCQILMYGPPGCGKSFVAEAIAGELGCAYAVINASDLLDKYVGEGPKKVVQIFKEAERYDNCLIFFDELDAVFSSRESDDSRYTKDILTTFLTCLSGFHADKSGGIKVIIGATNRPWALDSALIRGKRFDTHIYVGLPDADARKFLIEKAFRKHPALLENTDVTCEELAEKFDGYSCADISSMLDKMKSKAFERALDNRSNGIEAAPPVTAADAAEVMASYRNSVSQEALKAFKAFANGEI